MHTAESGKSAHAHVYYSLNWVMSTLQLIYVPKCRVSKCKYNLMGYVRSVMNE